MRRCDEFQTWFAEYLGQVLPTHQRRELEDHLAFCPTCSQLLAAERRLDQLLAAQPLATPSPDFTLQVLTRLQREHAPAPSFGKWLLNSLPYAASAAALLAGLNRVLGALDIPWWDKARAAVAQAYTSLDALGQQPSIALPPGLLEGTTSLAICGVLALLTLALYLSLAEEY